MDHATTLDRTAPGLVSLVDASPSPIQVQTEAVEDSAGWRVRTIVCRRGRVLRRIDQPMACEHDGVPEASSVASQHCTVVSRLERLGARRMALAAGKPVYAVLLEWTVQRCVEAAWPALGTETLVAMLRELQARLWDEHPTLVLFDVTADARVQVSETCPDFLPVETVDGVAAWVAHVLAAATMVAPELADTPIRQITAPMRDLLERFGFYRAYAAAREACTVGRTRRGSGVIGRMVPKRIAVAV